METEPLISEQSPTGTSGEQQKQAYSALDARLKRSWERFVAYHFRIPKFKRPKRVLIGGSALVIVFMLVFHFIFLPPAGFPVGTLVHIEKGASLDEVAYTFRGRGIIRSPLTFRIIITYFSPSHAPMYGDYFFETPESIWTVAQRVAAGDFGLDPIRVTFPEGITSYQIADILEKKLPSFPREAFLTLAETEEGYMFPDTYQFLPNVLPEEIIREMQRTFDRKVISALAEDITSSDRTLSDVIIMASIVEKEAITYKDKRMVAGILWKRIDIDMPLQVDAPFQYEIGKSTFELTRKDLMNDSDYNTYTRKGLPIGPIANPGLESIEATLNPIPSNYLFYLSDYHSQMHYSATYQEHMGYKAMYLD
ncbi:MAG: endolytic transglycosylase MltG [Candidatus Yonathbacteria bacterium]|nr:endolytic transglycosylase MltG [Candidatus Yonathbacteria bacterium]NTW47911.1 endolytic transglycosylase MltG [Candidatus Yonathbacteria bacterium]